jgi:LDH2 family malate/lactate/ureidoglycolate dehydrogenase
LSNSNNKFPAEILSENATRVIKGMGAPEDLAVRIADSLVLSNLVGHDSHGIIRLVEYSGWVREGNLIPDIYPKLEFNNEATALVDGGWGWGQSASYLATETVISAARKFGTASVVLSKTNHVGRLGEYVDLIAASGMMGLAFCNTGGAIVTPFGGIKRVMGTNPFAWSLPGSGEFNYVLDFSTAVVAAGKVIMAAMSGEPIDSGLILDKDGSPSINADDLMNGGALLPFGGHKGSGMSALIDLAAGALAGNMPAAISQSGYGNGTVILALDISRFASILNFKGIASQFELIMHSAGEPGRVLMPGEFEHQSKIKRKQSGIEISEGIQRNITEVANYFGVKVPEFA